MRLIHRRKVLVPQPEGPMKAVICWAGISSSRPLSAWNEPYQLEKPRTVMAVCVGAVGSAVCMAGLGGGWVGSVAARVGGYCRGFCSFWRMNTATPLKSSSTASCRMIALAAIAWNDSCGRLAQL